MAPPASAGTDSAEIDAQPVQAPASLRLKIRAGNADTTKDRPFARSDRPPRARPTNQKRKRNAACRAFRAAKETETMATTRPSQRQLAKAENVRRRAEMEREIADGHLVVRRMTRCERDQSDARWSAAAKARASGGKRRRY
jgi:hypothetical protein